MPFCEIRGFSHIFKPLMPNGLIQNANVKRCISLDRRCYIESAMKKNDIARKLARQSRVSSAEAADRLDDLIHSILHSLRAGQDAELPGLGRFTPARNGRVRFLRDGEPRD
jgi:hypothetical protein